MKIGNLVKVLNVDLPEAEGYENQIGVIVEVLEVTQDFSDQWDVLVCLVAGETKWFRAEVLVELEQDDGVQLARQEWANLRSPSRRFTTSIATKRAIDLNARRCGVALVEGMDNEPLGFWVGMLWTAEEIAELAAIKPWHRNTFRQWNGW